MHSNSVASCALAPLPLIHGTEHPHALQPCRLHDIAFSCLLRSCAPTPLPSRHRPFSFSSPACSNSVAFTARSIFVLVALMRSNSVAFNTEHYHSRRAHALQLCRLRFTAQITITRFLPSNSRQNISYLPRSRAPTLTHALQLCRLHGLVVLTRFLILIALMQSISVAFDSWHRAPSCAPTLSP
jgi:hypothetical protein